MKLTRPQPLRFELDSGVCLVVPPTTRAQMREAIALDPAGDAPEDPVAADARRGRQLAMLLQDAETGRRGDGEAVAIGSVLENLMPVEEQEILSAIVVAHHGGDPVNAVAVTRALRTIALKKKAVDEMLQRAGETPSKPSTATPTI